jgi:hypothetical protein
MPDFPDSYEQLRSRLAIDLMNIDDELMRMPSLVQDAAELAAAASDAENETHLVYDISKAQFALRVRSEGHERVTEASIDRQAPLDPAVQAARQDYEHARTYASLCGSLVSSLRTKSSLLQKASDLMVAGFVTPSSAYERERGTIRRARNEQALREVPAERSRPTLIRRFTRD